MILATRFLSSCLIAAAIALSLCGCKSSPPPQLVYDRIFEKIIHGDLQTASAEVDQAVARYQPTSVEWGWRFKILKAQILITQSRAQPALDLLGPDLPASLVASDIAVRKLNYQAMAYRIQQDFPRAEAKVAQAQQLAEASQPSLLSEVLNSRGAIDFDEQKYPEAEASFRSALDSARRNNLSRQELASLGNLVRITIVNRHYAEAIDQSQAALSIAGKMNMGSLEAALLGNLGWCYFQLGDFVSALDYFNQARDASDKLKITGNTFYWEGNVAQSYQELHRYDQARQLLKQSLDNSARIDNRQLMTESLNSLVRLDLITGQRDEAEQFSSRAIGLEKSGLDHLGALESRMLAGRLKTLDGNYAEAHSLLDQAFQQSAPGDALKWESLAGLARLDDAQSHDSVADALYRKSLALFESSRSAIERDDLRISYLARGIQVYDAYLDFLVRHHHPLAALRIADQSRSRTLAEGLANGSAAASQTNSFDPRELARRFNSTLLFYWLGEERSYLWAITPSRTDLFLLPSAREIDPLVHSYGEALLGSRNPLDDRNADGEHLYRMLIQPALKDIPSNSRIIILPDGSLYGLNFEALIVPSAKPHYWIEDATLTTAASLTLLRESAQSRRPPSSASLFLVGNTNPPNPGFPPLPQAASEMQQVEKYFPASRREVLSGNAATPAAYLTHVPDSYAYIHFVTHGTASRARPLESAVILSKDPHDDAYKLYARDIVKHHLSAALVTISACNGAGTREYTGEGLVGLSWAFLRAGAHDVIGALWEVSDVSTPQLMGDLYDGLSHGKDPASALRAAKLSFLHSDSVFRKPYYWAPFQLYSGS
ncbi:MAG TPA: CHAT domain-containing protein [Candidatus Acidoferrum sp.]|nr:CHAT domain-containing protein [Candidatus Acidoferrum sp.]